ncbi:glycosyltransferase family 1 protein [uncultured Chryseobacterium sp.]|uniref:glycosyltransferase family 4 protein n=1 Tax=uncultured Chryseobacterium sp. TaxID=259322 RepID=UPI0025DB7E71|nr:glycosyltransferase family 1 protein [uncultured Chryseobacterium sp.]
MKIIFDNIIYNLQNSGGGSVYWTELIKRFNNLNSDEIVFYEPKEPNQNIFRKELVLKNVKKETFLNLSIRRYLTFTIPVRSKSIFHSSYFRISKSKNAINITTIHDFTTERFRRGLARWVNLQQKRYAVKNSDGIICISENTKKDLLYFCPNVDEKKIRVIYNGVSDDFFKIKDLSNFKLSNFGFEKFQNKKLVLFVGHRTSYKNFDKAVLAFAKLNNNNYHFVIVGERLNESELNLVEKNITKNDFTVLNGLNNEKLNLLYNISFVLVYPSSYEGFGIPLVEAMKTGLPFVASHNSSLPEVAGDAGIIVKELSSEIISIAISSLEKQDLRQEIISRGFIQSDKFNWDRTFKAYHDFYKELYNER